MSSVIADSSNSGNPRGLKPAARYTKPENALTPPMFSKEILSNPDTSIPHCHCPSLVLAPNGDLLIAWYGYPQEETRGGVLYFVRKRARNARFDQPRQIHSDLKSSLGNPVLFCGKGGRIHLLFVALRGIYWDSAMPFASHSDDMGVTWSSPQSLRMGEGMMMRHGPLARDSETFVLPAYDEKKNETVLFQGDANGSGWQKVHRFKDTLAIQGSIVRQSDRELVMMLRPVGERRLCIRSISEDNGRSWSKAIPTPLPNPLSGLAAVQVGDQLLNIYNHTTEHQRFPLSLAYSTDRGTSWSDPVHIDETQHELSYPSFAVDQDGVVHGAYTFGRTRISYVTFDKTWWMR